MKKALILILIIAILATALVGCEEKGEPIVWSGLLMGEYLPELEGAVGNLQTNDEDRLALEFFDITEMKFGEYVVLCKEFGYTVDSEKLGSSFEAYNEEGYRIYLSFWSSSEKLSVDLDAPMEMEEIEWPSSELAKGIPMPKSNVGNVEDDEEDFFVIYLGETTKEDFEDYVSLCVKKGFSINEDKSETYFHAENKKGTELTVEYKGANVIYIRADLKSEEPEQETKPEKETEPAPTEESKKEDSGKLGKEFKKAMDEYEEFMDKYVAFMKKYQKNPTDLSLLADYAEYMSDYADFMEAFEEWEDQDLNAAEMAYYIKVQSRISKKLLEVAA